MQSVDAPMPARSAGKAPDARRNARSLELAVAVAVAIVVGGLGFLDDLLESRRVSHVDVAVAVGIGVLALVSLLAFRRARR